MALNFGNKIENEGATPQGRLSAEEFNTLVAQVNTNETNIGTKTSKDSNTGRLLYSEASKVVLDSMGDALDEVTGGSSYSPQNGDTVYVPTRQVEENIIDYQKIVYIDSEGVSHASDPDPGLLYSNKRTNKIYRWNPGTSLPGETPVGNWIQVGISEGSGGSGSTDTITELINELGEEISKRQFFNVSFILENSEESPMTISEFIAATAGSGYDDLKVAGTIISLNTPDGWKLYQYNGGIWALADNWREVGASPKIGNCYNVTVNVPLVSGYYTLETAVSATYYNAPLTFGMSITFAVGNLSWKTYQFVGNDLTRLVFTNTDNWRESGGFNIRAGASGFEISADGGTTYVSLITYDALLQKTHVFCSQSDYNQLVNNNEIDSSKIYMIFEND